MKLETLNASRSGLIRAYSLLRADLVFHRVFPDQKKEGGILYNFKWPNHFQPWSLPSIGFRKLIPSSAASLPLLSILCHVFLWPISSCLAEDIKIMPKIVCVSSDVVNFTEAKAATGNYFGRHCFHFSMPLKLPAPHTPLQSHDWYWWETHCGIETDTSKTSYYFLLLCCM